MPNTVTPHAGPATSRFEFVSIAVTVAAAIACLIIAWFSYLRLPGVLAISLGCLGGLTHEFAQSGGKILFFESKEDGFYVGSLAGLVLGGVAALLVVRGFLTNDVVELQRTDYVNLSYEAFMAGLGLKGIVEATAGTPVTAPAASQGAEGQARAVVTSLPKPPSQLLMP